jgi:hypothetical protein
MEEIDGKSAMPSLEYLVRMFILVSRAKNSITGGDGGSNVLLRLISRQTT